MRASPALCGADNGQFITILKMVCLPLWLGHNEVINGNGNATSLVQLQFLEHSSDGKRMRKLLRLVVNKDFHGSPGM